MITSMEKHLRNAGDKRGIPWWPRCCCARSLGVLRISFSWNSFIPSKKIPPKHISNGLKTFIPNLSYGTNKIKTLVYWTSYCSWYVLTFVSGNNILGNKTCTLEIYLGVNLGGLLHQMNQPELRSTILFILFITNSQSQLTPPRRLLLLLSFLPVAQPKTTQQHSCKPPEWGIRREL